MTDARSKLQPEQDNPWADVSVALVGFVDSLKAAFLPAMMAMKQAIEELHAALWERYRAAGSPYGESDEGMRRFFREEMAFRQAVERYREERSWRRSLIAPRERFHGDTER